jgi:hypothetical protein
MKCPAELEDPHTTVPGEGGKGDPLVQVGLYIRQGRASSRFRRLTVDRSCTRRERVPIHQVDSREARGTHLRKLENALHRPCKLRGRHRLYQVITHPRSERPDGKRLGVLLGEHEDGQRGKITFALLQCPEPVAAGIVVVEAKGVGDSLPNRAGHRSRAILTMHGADVREAML